MGNRVKWYDLRNCGKCYFLRRCRLPSSGANDTLPLCIAFRVISWFLYLFTHIYITGELPFNALKLAAGLVIGWQVWSCLENISSCNGAKWAKLLQQVMIDKTERHFDVNINDYINKEDENTN